MRAPGGARSMDPIREKTARLVARPFFALLAFLARVLPRRALVRTSVAASRAVYSLFPGIRQNLLENARRALGPTAASGELRARGLQVLESFAHFLVDLLSPGGKGSRQDLAADTTGREHFEAARARGKGIIAATLHMGNYELSSRELARLEKNVAVVYNRDRIGFVEALRSRRRKEVHLDEIVIGESKFFGIEALRRLREGGIILLSGDQVEARDGEPLPFLHGTAPFSLWPVQLSLASGAPILPAFNVRVAGGRHRLHLEPPIYPRPGRSPVEMLLELVQVFERYVEEHGGEWLMIRRFWIDPEDAARSASGSGSARGMRAGGF